MLLAAALKRKKELKGEIAKLTNSLRMNSVLYDKDENPDAIIREITMKHEALWMLNKSIDSANQTNKLENGMILTEARLRRDYLVSLSGFFTMLSDAQSSEYDHDAEKKVKIIIDRAAFKARAGEAAKEARELDEMLQKANWSVEI